MRRRNVRERRREKKAQEGAKLWGTRRALPGHPGLPSPPHRDLRLPSFPLVPTSFVSGINTPAGKRGPRAGWEEKGRDGAAGSARRGPHGWSRCRLCTKRNIPAGQSRGKQRDSGRRAAAAASPHTGLGQRPEPAPASSFPSALAPPTGPPTPQPARRSLADPPVHHAAPPRGVRRAGIGGARGPLWR